MSQQQQQRQTFGYVNMWTRESGALVASGSISFKRDALDDLITYLEKQEGDYLRLDIALFQADEGKSYDFQGKVQELYVKEAKQEQPKPRRSL